MNRFLLVWNHPRLQEKYPLVDDNRRQSHYWFLRHTAMTENTVVPTRLCRVWAVRLGEGSRTGASFARVLLLTWAPPPVVELLAIWLLASSEHAHWPPGLFHHVHNAVQHLKDGETSKHFLLFSHLWREYHSLLNIIDHQDHRVCSYCF